ncbi:MAG: hypothetical protein ACI4XJ_09140 [Eubacteriales bacterium]
MNFLTPAKCKRLPIIYIVFAALTAVTYFFAMKNDFDADIGHFAFGSVPFYICASVTALSALAAVISSYSSKKYVYASIPENGAVYYFGACLSAILALVIFVIGLGDMRLTVLSGGASFSSLPAKLKFELFELILTPFIAVSYILSLFEKTKVSKIRAALTVLAAVSLNLSLFSCYFDFSIPLNSPVRNYITIMDSSILLFLLSEARLSFPAEEKRASYSFSVFASGVSASVTLGISAGMILLRLICPIADDPNPDLYRCALYFAISLTAEARLFSLTGCAKDKPNEKTAENTGDNA